MVRLLLFLAGLSIAGNSAARAPNPATIKFLYEDARIYVPVRIGAGPPHWFILDTGATGTIIDSAVAKQARLAVTGGQTVHGAGSGGSTQARTSAITFTVGSVPLRVAQPAVMDLAHLLGPTSGRAPGGIIGSQFFREHFVDVDFESHRIRLYPPTQDRRREFTASIPLEFADWTPLATVRLTLPTGRSVNAKALIDIGAKSTFLIPEPFIDRERLRGAFPASVTTAFGAGVGGDTYYSFARASRLGFAAAPAMAIERPIVGLSVNGTLRSTWHEGLLGSEFLSRFRVGFDYAHRRLLLTQLSDKPAAFDRSGLFLVAEGPDLRSIKVRSVLQHGPGDGSAIVAGDEILSIDGAPAWTMGLAAVRNRLKEPLPSVTFGYRHGGERRTARIKLRDLL